MSFAAETQKAAQEPGKKNDAGKPKMSLLFQAWRALVGIVRVLEFGLWKYKARGGWLTVPNAEERYTDAMLRHAAAIGAHGLKHLDICEKHPGGVRPPGCKECSGLPSIYHLGCDALFLGQFSGVDDPGQPWLAANDDKPKESTAHSPDAAARPVFKRGDWVKCVDDRGASELRTGDMYLVDAYNVDGPFRQVILAHHGRWSPERFELVVKP